MADHANLLVLKGNLGHDPQFNTTNGGKDVANIFIATNAPRYKAADGEWRSPEPEWCSVSVFIPQAIALLRDLKKGDAIEVRASVGQETFFDRDGIERKAHGIKVSNRYLGHLVKRREVPKSNETQEGAQ